MADSSEKGVSLNLLTQYQRERENNKTIGIITFHTKRVREREAIVVNMRDRESKREREREQSADLRRMPR